MQTPRSRRCQQQGQKPGQTQGTCGKGWPAGQATRPDLPAASDASPRPARQADAGDANAATALCGGQPGHRGATPTTAERPPPHPPPMAGQPREAGEWRLGACLPATLVIFLDQFREDRHGHATARPGHPVAQGRGGGAAARRSCRPRAVIDDPAETRAYECDALTAYRCPPLAAVLPGSTAEVAAVLRLCHEMGVPVVPRGSGTSLAGGALPTADCVILGVARMNRVLETDYRRPLHPGRDRAHQPVASPARSRPTGSSMPPTRRRSWPAPSPAISR